MHIHRGHLCLLLSGYLSGCKIKKLQWLCVSLRVPVCMRNRGRDRGKVFSRGEKIFGTFVTRLTLAAKGVCGINYLCLHQCVTLTVPLARLLLCQFLLRCDFQHRQAPAGIQLL